MAKRYSVHEICDAISDLSDTQESDVSDSCSKYLPEQPEPKDFDSDDSEVSSNNEPEDSANEDMIQKATAVVVTQILLRTQ